MIESCLRDLGREVVTVGVFKHVVMGLPSSLIPLSLIGGRIAKTMRNTALLKK